jgi:4-hydroxythreonine-4-phosphate dehydrogenase
MYAINTMNKSIMPIVISAGEPAGIGIDLVVMLSQRNWDVQLVVITDPQVLIARAQQLALPINIHIFDPKQAAQASTMGNIWVLPVYVAEPCIAGKLNSANSHYVLATLKAAIEGINAGYFSALVTGPVHKGIINEAGIPFTGHTEWLAEQANNVPVVMMLACSALRVALATTHLPLKEVSAAITTTGLSKTLSILHDSLINDFGITQPRILVAGLNPHAGEDGYLGREEIDIITPVCRAAQEKGWLVSNPLPADTLFTPPFLARTDAVLSMFHDQGLPVLKHLGFGNAVNITLGLPFIRTSVDHGTALDLAGTGKAEVGSFITAINTAIDMAKQRKKTA